MTKNIFFTIMIIIIFGILSTNCSSIPDYNNETNKENYHKNRSIKIEDSNDNNIIIQKKVFDEFELNISSDTGNIDPFAIPLVIKNNEKEVLSTYIEYKNRDLIRHLSSKEIIINGKYIITSSGTLQEIVKDKYIFDFSINPKRNSMALLIKDVEIGLYLYDFSSNNLKKLYSLNFDQQNFDINLTLDWLDENNIVFDCSQNGKPGIYKYNIVNDKLECIIQQGMNPRVFNSSISYIITTDYNINKSQQPISTIFYDTNKEMIKLDGWYKRANINDKYLLLYNTHLNPEKYENYNKNYIIGNNLYKEISLKGRPFFPRVNIEDNIDYIYLNNGILIHDLIKLN